MCKKTTSFQKISGGEKDCEKREVRGNYGVQGKAQGGNTALVTTLCFRRKKVGKAESLVFSRRA